VNQFELMLLRPAWGSGGTTIKGQCVPLTSLRQLSASSGSTSGGEAAALRRRLPTSTLQQIRILIAENEETVHADSRVVLREVMTAPATPTLEAPSAVSV
jgi:hypothetical protein